MQEGFLIRQQPGLKNPGDWCQRSSEFVAMKAPAKMAAALLYLGSPTFAGA